MRATTKSRENKRSNQQSKVVSFVQGLLSNSWRQVTKDLKVVDLETNAGMLEQTSVGYEGLRAEELMPDLGPRAGRGSAIGT
jgi:hypothetical protein